MGVQISAAGNPDGQPAHGPNFAATFRLAPPAPIRSPAIIEPATETRSDPGPSGHFGEAPRLRELLSHPRRIDSCTGPRTLGPGKGRNNEIPDACSRGARPAIMAVASTLRGTGGGRRGIQAARNQPDHAARVSAGSSGAELRGRQC